MMTGVGFESFRLNDSKGVKGHEAEFSIFIETWMSMLYHSGREARGVE